MSDPLAYLDNSDAFDQRERQQRVQGQLKRVDPTPRRKPSAAEDLRTLQRKARDLLCDEAIPSHQRLIHLRRTASELQTRVRDDEMRRLLGQERRKLMGAVEPIPQGGKLSFEEAPWLWENVLLKATSNLFVGPPKVGKSRLMCAVLGALVRGETSFLGQPLHPWPDPKILIVGSDQPQRDWAICLKRAGLLYPDRSMHPSIISLFHKGAPLSMDEEGIERIAGYCTRYPGLIVLLDSYHALTSRLGLQECDASFADPCIDLTEALAPHEATLLLIHHAKKRPGALRASEASRGNNALPGAVSQTLAISSLGDGDDNPLAQRDKRIKLMAEGRESAPIDLLIEQTNTGWIFHGSGEEVARQAAIQGVLDDLTDRQYKALKDLCGHYQSTKKGMDAVHLGNALGLEVHATSKAREALQALERKHLIVEEGYQQSNGKRGGPPAALFRPVDEVLKALTR